MIEKKLVRKLELLLVVVVFAVTSLKVLAGSNRLAIATLVFGEIKVKRGHNEFELKEGAALESKDVLKLAQGANLELRFDKGHVLRVAGPALLKLYPTTVKLKRGKVWLNVVKTDQGFRVVTPSFVAAVKGTCFGVDYSYKSRSGKAVVWRGLVVVRSSKQKRYVGEKEAVEYKSGTLKYTDFDSAVLDFAAFNNWNDYLVKKAYDNWMSYCGKDENKAEYWHTVYLRLKLKSLRFGK